MGFLNPGFVPEGKASIETCVYISLTRTVTWLTLAAKESGKVNILLSNL